MAQVIYKIINIDNGKFYVGSSTNAKERFRAHRKLLTRGAHHCKHLQAAWNKYGVDAFLFRVIEEVPDDMNLQAAEDRWLQEHVGKEHCYNIGHRSDAPWRGGKKEDHPQYGVAKSEATKQKISETLKQMYAEGVIVNPTKGKRLSVERRAQMSAVRMGQNAGAEHYRFGKTLSTEVRKKIGDAQRGKKKAPRTLTPEGRAKIDAAAAAGHYASFAGKKHTPEARAKMSKRVHERTTDTTFNSLTDALQQLNLKMPTLRRALVSGKPLSKGPNKGLMFHYVDFPTKTVVR